MKHLPELVQHAIDGIKGRDLESTYGQDLHNSLFNEDYYIIGYYEAEQWLIANVGIFSAIEEIKEYEELNFGKVSTDLSSSESVVNMYVYIKGEELINSLSVDLDGLLEKETISSIIEELEELL